MIPQKPSITSIRNTSNFNGLSLYQIQNKWHVKTTRCIKTFSDNEAVLKFKIDNKTKTLLFDARHFESCRENSFPFLIAQLSTSNWSSPDATIDIKASQMETLLNPREGFWFESTCPSSKLPCFYKLLEQMKYRSLNVFHWLKLILWKHGASI